MATYLDEYRNRKLSFAPLLQAGKMTLRDTWCTRSCCTASRCWKLANCCVRQPQSPQTPGNCWPLPAGGRRAVLRRKGARLWRPVQEQGKARRKAAGENLAKIVADCRKRFSSFQAKSPEQYRQSISAMVGTVLVAWVQLRNTYVPIGEEAKQK